MSDELRINCITDKTDELIIRNAKYGKAKGAAEIAIINTYNTSIAHIDKDGAAKIIKHLTKHFNLTTTESE